MFPGDGSGPLRCSLSEHFFPPRRRPGSCLSGARAAYSTVQSDGNRIKTDDKSDDARAEGWSGRSRGGAFGTWFFITIVRLLGLRVAYLPLAFVAGYFLIGSPRGVRASAEYHRRLAGSLGPLRLLGRIYRQFYVFGMVLLDRLAMIGAKSPSFHIEHEGVEGLRRAIEAGRGVILLGAHAGNWQAAGHLLSRYDTPVNLVVLENEIERIRAMTERATAGRSFRLIAVDAEFTQAFEIMAALRRGEIVAIHGDRVYAGRAVRVPFLGREAPFPVGPYMLAAVSGAALVQVFAMREGTGRYRFIAHEPQWLVRPPRRERQEFFRLHAALYAERLEAITRRYPYQWFNFYPFWDAEAQAAGDGAGSRAESEGRSADKG